MPQLRPCAVAHRGAAIAVIGDSGSGGPAQASQIDDDVADWLCAAKVAVGRRVEWLWSVDDRPRNHPTFLVYEDHLGVLQLRRSGGALPNGRVARSSEQRMRFMELAPSVGGCRIRL